MNFGKPMSDTQKVLGLMAAFPGTSEKIAKAELKEVYQRFAEINADNWANAKEKFIEMGFDALDKMDKAMQYGPYANMFKTMASMSGVITEKAQADQTVTQGTPTPQAQTVRDRIAKLMDDPKIKERAKRAGLDLAELDTRDADK